MGVIVWAAESPRETASCDFPERAVTQKATLIPCQVIRMLVVICSHWFSWQPVYSLGLRQRWRNTSAANNLNATSTDIDLITESFPGSGHVQFLLISSSLHISTITPPSVTTGCSGWSCIMGWINWHFNQSLEGQLISESIFTANCGRIFRYRVVNVSNHFFSLVSEQQENSESQPVSKTGDDQQ